jgi:hypothetical protein
MLEAADVGLLLEGRMTARNRRGVVRRRIETLEQERIIHGLSRQGQYYLLRLLGAPGKVGTRGIVEAGVGLCEE